MDVIPAPALHLWHPELALLATVLVGAIASVRAGRWSGHLVTAGLLVASVLAAYAGGTGHALGAHVVIDDTAASARVVILLAALLVSVNLPGQAHRAATGLALAALGALVLSQAVTVGSLLLGTAMAIAGGTLAARIALASDAADAVRRWHAAATVGFALAAVGAASWSGFGGTLTLVAVLDNLAQGPDLPLLSLSLVAALVGVGLGLALLGEPGRFGAAAPPSLTGWLTAVPALALVTVVARVLAAVPDASVFGSLAAVVTLAAMVLVLGGFLAAMVQTQLERRLAWAATGQVGLALLGCTTLDQAGADAAHQHMLCFVPAQLGALLVAGVVAGLPTDVRRRHMLAFLLAALLVALSALPPLAGWRPRFGLVQALVAADRGLTAALVMAGTLLGCLVYLRPLVDLWRPAAAPAAPDGTMSVVPVLTAAALLAVLLARGLGLMVVP